MFRTSRMAVSVVAVVGCATSPDSESTTQAVELDPAVCAPEAGGFSLVSTNPYFPIDVGHRWIYEGEEDGEAVLLHITVLKKTELVAGVETRVIEEREWIDGELAEVSRNFFVEARDGTVCYFGEAVDIYENHRVVSHEGAWRADEPGNAPGIIMPAEPHSGQQFPIEIAPGVAEDEAAIVGVGTTTVPAGTFTETIRVRETNPLDGGTSTKIYAAGVGLIVDGPVQLVSAE